MMDNGSKIFKWSNVYVLIVIALTYTASQFWPVFSISGLFILIGFLLSLFLSFGYYTSKIFLPLFYYLIIVAANVFFGDSYFSDAMQLMYESAYLIIPSSMLFYFTTNKKSDDSKTVVYVFLIILILTTLATYIISRYYPGVIRNGRAYANSNGDSFYQGLYRYGLSTYDMTHAVPCLVPVLFYSWRQSFRKCVKIFLLASIFACLVLSYVSGSFACLVMSFSALIISIFIKPGSIRNNTTSFAVLGILMLIVLNDNVLLGAAGFLDQLLGTESDFHEKLMDIQQTILTGEGQGDFEARNQLYNNSYSSFLSNILLGSDGTQLGRHSAMLDRLGALGLIGFIPYIIFLYRSLSFAYQNISDNSKIYYLVGVFISLSMLLSKALSGWNMWLVLLFILPSVLQVFDQTNDGYISISEYE